MFLNQTQALHSPSVLCGNTISAEIVINQPRRFSTATRNSRESFSFDAAA